MADPAGNEVDVVHTDASAADVAQSAVLGMFEVQLVTSRHAAMVDFYRDVVGLDVRIHDEHRGRTHLGLAPDGSQLILVAADGDEVAPQWIGLPPQLFDDDDVPVTGPPTVGPVHFALHVPADDQLAVAGRIEAAGHRVRGPLAWGDDLVSRYALDPDGNCVELIGR